MLTLPPPPPSPCRPFFTVALSYLFLGTMPSVTVMLTLLPIVAGVVVASATDLSFNWWGEGQGGGRWRGSLLGPLWRVWGGTSASDLSFNWWETCGK